jgi:predicted transcriptional regulator
MTEIAVGLLAHCTKGEFARCGGVPERQVEWRKMTTLDLFRHDFVLSIKPEYALKIVEGVKKVELRRRFPPGAVTGARLYVYATVPIQALIGYATISRIDSLPVEDIWRYYNEVACINREDFDAYYRGLGLGYVIVLKDVVQLARPIPLAVLKEKLAFTPPQSFAYADDGFRQIVSGVSNEAVN